nr:MAG TPA: hypothetical protein [Caudoviricetes sp.]
MWLLYLCNFTVFFYTGLKYFISAVLRAFIASSLLTYHPIVLCGSDMKTYHSTGSPYKRIIPDLVTNQVPPLFRHSSSVNRGGSPFCPKQFC